MNRQTLYERILILFAAVLATFLIVYNALSAPDARTIRVYYQQSAVHEPSSAAPASSAAPEASEETTDLQRVNLNSATLEELTTLKGVGPAKAQAIVEYREAYGPFRSVDELTLVDGIGERMLEQLRDDICI